MGNSFVFRQKCEFIVSSCSLVSDGTEPCHCCFGRSFLPCSLWPCGRFARSQGACGVMFRSGGGSWLPCMCTIELLQEKIWKSCNPRIRQAGYVQLDRQGRGKFLARDPSSV